jgi:hypothetical protein
MRLSSGSAAARTSAQPLLGSLAVPVGGCGLPVVAMFSLLEGLSALHRPTRPGSPRNSMCPARRSRSSCSRRARSTSRFRCARSSAVRRGRRSDSSSKSDGPVRELLLVRRRVCPGRWFACGTGRRCGRERTGRTEPRVRARAFGATARARTCAVSRPSSSPARASRRERAETRLPAATCGRGSAPRGRRRGSSHAQFPEAVVARLRLDDLCTERVSALGNEAEVELWRRG